MSSQEDDKRDVVTFPFRMSRAQHSRLSALAEREHRSLTGELRRLVDQRLAEEPEEMAA